MIKLEEEKSPVTSGLMRGEQRTKQNVMSYK